MKFKSDQSSQKLRGGYYTPSRLADYVTEWVLGANPISILEPSCGDGSFLQSIKNNSYTNKISISAFELFDSEVEKARSRCESLKFKDCTITEGDFLDWANLRLFENAKLFDGVIGNPPFIRYQFLDKPFQNNTEQVFKTLDLKFTKHTNAWVPFVLASIALLKPSGRLGMVIPSEIIHVLHAQSLRTFLAEMCKKIVLIDPQEIWFEDTLQGAVIILAEKKSNLSQQYQGVAIKHVKGSDFLNIDPNTIFNDACGVNGSTVSGKWTKALLENDVVNLIDRLCEKKNVYKFSEIADVDVGIVTGANSFFLIDDCVVEKYGFHDYVSPMFGRSSHCKGIIYNRKQHQANKKSGYPTNFLYLQDDYDSLPKKIKSYIDCGEALNLHKRYKCSIRKPWYKVPSVYSTKIGMLKRAHDAPRLIFNELNAYTTDTAYRIKSFEIEDKKLVYCFINPLTAIFAELQGRYYGGGVLELVPSEIESLFVPIPDNIEVNIQELDKMIKTLPMKEVLLQQGFKVLGSIGVSKKDIRLLVETWEFLKNRRQRIHFD